MAVPDVAARLRAGGVIPAHPLALDPAGEVDWAAQRALTRYYVQAGAQGIAVGVHTTQFELHDDPGLLRDVLVLAAETARAGEVADAGTPLLIAGVTGDVAQARSEAERARDLGYDAVLLSLRGCAPDAPETALVERTATVGAVLPVIAFYMQQSIGGRYLSPAYWQSVFALDSTVAVKTAAFDRYRTQDVAQAILESDRWAEVALLTGNDDAIVHDLITPYRRSVAGKVRQIKASGGLLGQWAVGTRAAVRLVDELRTHPTAEHLALASDLVEVNAAVFDAAHRFRGAVAGVNEVLAQQGLLPSSRCLSGHEVLSPGQRELIAGVRDRYPHLLDEAYVAEHADAWLS